MMAIKEENKNAIETFLENNSISPEYAMGYNNKFEIRYFVGERRMFSEETTVGFNIMGTSDVNVSLYDINHIEYETSFKITEQTFSYDEVRETLTITGTSKKTGNDVYKVVINSIYLDF